MGIMVKEIDEMLFRLEEAIKGLEQCKYDMQKEKNEIPILRKRLEGALKQVENQIGRTGITYVRENFGKIYLESRMRGSFILGITIFFATIILAFPSIFMRSSFGIYGIFFILGMGIPAGISVIRIGNQLMKQFYMLSEDSMPLRMHKSNLVLQKDQLKEREKALENKMVEITFQLRTYQQQRKVLLEKRNHFITRKNKQLCENIGIPNTRMEECISHRQNVKKMNI